MSGTRMSSGFPDPVAEQLYDELFCRAWTVSRIDPAMVVVDPGRPAVARRLRAVACELADELEGPNATAAAARIYATLSPVGQRPDDAWWPTPLGRRLRAAAPMGQPAPDCRPAPD